MGNDIICFLVDDDEDDHEIFTLALREVDKSVKCVVACDGVEALEKFEADETFIPHCMFLDLNMPRMGGMECLEEIKKIKRLENVPVFMYSTSSSPEFIEEAKRLGATDYIIKPSGFTPLIRMLKEVFLRQQQLPDTRSFL